MRYTLLLHYPEMAPDALGVDGQEAGERAFDAYAAALEQAGVLIAAEVLRHSDSTTTVRRRGGELQVQDGPYADTKEQLAGSFVIEVPSRDAAVRWAGAAPLIEHGWVEVRPGLVHFADGGWRANE